MSDRAPVTLQDQQPGAIRPEVLANTLAAMRRLELPRLTEAAALSPRFVEALWSIQFFSMQPGGLGKFARELAEFSAPRLGTKTMRHHGSRKYSASECVEIWHELPRGERGELEGRIDEQRGTRARDEYEDEEEYFNRCRAIGCEPREHRWDDELRRQLNKENEPFLRNICREAAVDGFGKVLVNICEGQRDSIVTWFCADVIAEVLAFIDHRAIQVEQRLARTAVAVKVFDALDYASIERVMVRIEGDSRFGKTEAVETWAAMWPGRALVVRTPSSNNEKDLFKAIAEAFGIATSFGTAGRTLKDKVEFVIRFSGLQIIFDEAAFLIPSNFSATTPPARLNWVRTAIVDRKVPCVLVVTPQSYQGAVDRFVKKTRYSIEQFLGREALRVPLPNELAHEDLLAVARIHFPGANEDLLGLVVAKALQSESYLKAVENIARRARYNATKRGARKFTIRDIDTAIDEVMPAPAAAVAKAPAPPTAAKRQPRGSRAAEVLQAPFKRSATQFPARETVPLRDSPEAAPVLATG